MTTFPKLTFDALSIRTWGGNIQSFLSYVFTLLATVLLSMFRLLSPVARYLFRWAQIFFKMLLHELFKLARRASRVWGAALVDGFGRFLKVAGPWVVGIPIGFFVLRAVAVLYNGMSPREQEDMMGNVALIVVGVVLFKVFLKKK